MWERWKQVARQLKKDVVVLYLVARDPRCPIVVKGLLVVIVGYAFSPIDLIPDLIPVLGQLDDVILLPIAMALVIRLIPADLLAECRARAENELAENRPVSRIAGVVIVTLWVLGIVFLIQAII